MSTRRFVRHAANVRRLEREPDDPGLHPKRERTGKICWPTKAAAKRARGRVQATGGRHMDVYRCRFGRHFHIGHPRQVSS